MTLTIRAIEPIEPFSAAGEVANGIMYMRIEVLNNSGQAWVEFEFELQEILDQPSMFGDGLSFDQRIKSPTTSAPSSFAEFDRDFEPYDRLLFKQRQDRSAEDGALQFLITDYTPRNRHILSGPQDPRIPSAR